MKTSIVYVTIKCVVQHPDGVDADDVVNECDYSITALDDDCKVLDTEMTDVEDHGECHPTEHYLLEDQRRDEKHGLYPQHEDPAN